MTDVPVVSMPKGKGQSDGGDALDPGQALPPSAWPGLSPGPVTPPPGDWRAGEDGNDIVTGPLPTLQALAGRFGSGLSTKEWLAFLRATANRGQPWSEDDRIRLLDYAEGWEERDRLILTALEIFRDGLVDALGGNGGGEGPQ